MDNSTSNTENQNQLALALRKLKPTGDGGFEELVKVLLENLTGRKFYLARSGNQEGRDISSDHQQGSVIAVECKRYGKTTELNERELLGELVQAATAIPDLDLWILATSRNLTSQLNDSLIKEAHYRGVEFYVINTGRNGDVGDLDRLCAKLPSIVSSYFEHTGINIDWEDILPWLNFVKSQSSYNKNINRLKSDLQAQNIGYDNWRTSINDRFLANLGSVDRSKANYGQILDVTNPKTQFVTRVKTNAKLQSWLNNWVDNKTALVILGSEGDGKTWTVAKWLSDKINEKPDFPPVIFLSSQQLGPSLDDPEELLVQVLKKSAEINRNEDFWRKRLKRWMSRESNNRPTFILVLDGINERHSHTFWRRLLEKLSEDSYRQRIALLITCRTGYWNEYFALLNHNKWETWTQYPYDDTELIEALAYQGLSKTDVDPSLYSLLRKPRFFDLMVKFREEMAESGDITPARLLYEDWRDRYQRKSSTPLSHAQFQNLLRDLAENHLQSQETTIRDYQIGNILPPIGDSTKEELLRELSTGGILVGTGGRYRVDKKMLTLGLGLLLADMVKDKCEGICEADFVYETTQQWLEPLGSDLNAEICEMAVYYALSTSYPQNGRVVLLQTWLESHNPGGTVEKYFPSYFPANPSLYFELAERIWAKNTENQWGQDLIMLTFLKWKDNDHVQQFQQVFEKWLGYVHSAGFPHQRGWHDEKEEKIRAIIEKRINNFLEPSLSVPERRGVANLPLTIVEDGGLLRLGRLALALISHLPRRLFLRSIIIGCLAEAVMNYPDKYALFAWVIRSSEEDLEQDIIDSVNDLLNISADNIVVLQAAHRMLSFVGTTKARMLQKQFPSDLFDNAAWHEEIKANPCKYTFPWPINICQTCITDTDIETLEPKPLAMNLRKCSLSPSFTVTKEITAKLERLTDSIEPDNIWIAMMNTSEDHTVDFSEPAFCAHIPQKYVEFLHHVIQTAENRECLPLRQMSIQLSKFIPIINEEEYQLLYQKWRQIISSYDSSDKTVVDTELFLFEFILSKQKADEQLKHILSRPADAGDLIRYETFFKQPTSWGEVQNRINGPQETIQTQRLLWYISLFAQEIPQDLLNDLIKLLTHGESFIRSLVLKIVFLSGNIDVAKRVIDSGWNWHPDWHSKENHWGSLILSKYGNNLTYAELQSRIHPIYWGYAVEQRGKQHIEINLFSTSIDRMWKTILNSDLVPLYDFPSSVVEDDIYGEFPNNPLLSLDEKQQEISFSIAPKHSVWGGVASGTDIHNVSEATLDFDLDSLEQRQNVAREKAQQLHQEQLQAGNLWFSRSFPLQSLAEVVRHRTDLVDKWISVISDQNPSSSQILWRLRSFYESLCVILLEVNTTLGVQLYWQLLDTDSPIRFVDAKTQLTTLDLALFNSSQTDKGQKAWDKKLSMCQSDHELMQIAFLAQHGKANKWLWTRIDKDIESPILFKQARAIKLLGFMSEEQAIVSLQSKLTSFSPDTWLYQITEQSLLFWQKNEWAIYWFNKFLSSSSQEQSWTSFRLFLRCVDSRFWLWKDSLVTSAGDHSEELIQFLNGNLEEIKWWIKKNEENLHKQFLGQKIQKNQVWPWMQAYLS